MMRKLVLCSFLALLAVSCKEDPKPVDDTYPTTKLTVERDVNPLLSLDYRMMMSAAGGIEVFRKTIGAKFEGEMSHITLITDPSEPLYTSLADSLSENFGLLTPFSFAVNNEVVGIPSISDEIDFIVKLEKPFLGVSHKVHQNDTSYIVDVKVEFFKDTVTDFIYVETYQLAAIDAKKYKSGTLDLRQAPDGTFLVNTDESTIWNKTVSTSDIDTSFAAKTLFTQGDQYVHDFVLLRNFAKDNAFGTRLSTYSKFGAEFYLNDIIGLKQNPIRHYFLKEKYLPKTKRKDFEYEAKFLTVVYFYNSLDQKYEIIDTYMK